MECPILDVEIQPHLNGGPLLCTPLGGVVVDPVTGVACPIVIGGRMLDVGTGQILPITSVPLFSKKKML